MPDLTTAAIAQLLIDARRTSYTLRPGGEKRVTLTLACVEMLCRELLAARAERDAAVAEAVLRERDRCEDIVQSCGKAAQRGEITDTLRRAVVAAIRRGE